MRKPIPPAQFSQIRPPNDNYVYFEQHEAYPFAPKANVFEIVNAGWLADFALLAYGDEKFIRDKSERSGLTAAGFTFRFFSRETTQCFVAHNDQLVVLSFRGTEIDNFMGAFTDWKRNLEFIAVADGFGGRVHQGFAQNIAEVWNDSGDQSGIKSHVEPILSSGARTLWITGHSLGAALAVLAAERAVRDGLTVNGVYTFGAPRIGDAQFKENYAALGLEERTYRFVHDEDVVRKLPPGDEYAHVGRLKFIDAQGRLSDDIKPDAVSDLPEPARAQQRAVRLFGLLGRKAGALVEGVFRLTIPEPFADHAPIYYASHIWNNLSTRHVE